VSNTGKQLSVICNQPPVGQLEYDEYLTIAYDRQDPDWNLTIGLPHFVSQVYHLNNRILDLLELSAFVYAVDRYTFRGSKEAIEYHSWGRNFDFHIKVRDYDFWEDKSVQYLLQDCLQFMTGDSSYHFTFYPGHSTEPTNMFDKVHSSIGDLINKRDICKISIIPFSGGLDSLAGVLEVLEKSNHKVMLVSHQSSPGIKKTQEALWRKLDTLYRGRIGFYPFQCHLSKYRAKEESQRTRSFLFCSIAFSIAQAYKLESFSIYENGVTSINLPRRQDSMNARTSRTTHPQVVYKLQQLFSLIDGSDFSINTPFINRTKKDIFEVFYKYNRSELISSAVSCSQTRNSSGLGTHCGKCFQCIERRIASFASNLTQFDHQGLYSTEIFSTPITDKEAKTAAVDYVRQAVKVRKNNLDRFQSDYFSDLSEIVDFYPGETDQFAVVEKLWNLMNRHGEAVALGLENARTEYDDIGKPLEKDSLLSTVFADREHLIDPDMRLVNSIISILQESIPSMFHKNKPTDENDLNDKIHAILKSHYPKLKSEHPAVIFALAKVVPDHELEDANLLIEAKYIRGSTSPSKASSGISEDITKYPEDKTILFVVYDPERSIVDDRDFAGDIEKKRKCKVQVIR